MERLIICVLFLGFVSPCLCVRWNVNQNMNSLYNVMDYGARGDGKSEDSQAFLNAWKSACRAEGTSTLIIPPNKLFMLADLVLSGPCKAPSIYIQLQGNIVAQSMNEWTKKSVWIWIEDVNGLTIEGNGQIDGDGSTWWQCKSCTRPTILHFHACNNLIVNGLRITNSPGAHVSINNCNGATFSNINIQSPADSPNTDGFDISESQNIVIQDSNIKSGDDCIAVNGGCFNINATRVACGPGHGISIGSLGRNNAHETVEEVHVQHCTFKGTTNGARIKTWPGGSGYARKITFEQIQLIDVSNPIIIDQHYSANDEQDSGVKVSEVTYRGFNGTSAGDFAIYLDCGPLGCSNLILEEIDIVSSESEKSAKAFTKNAHGKVESTNPIVDLNP